MKLRNIYFQNTEAPAVEPTREVVEEKPAVSEKMRIRKVTLSPADEYEIRGGNPRPISFELAAMLLYKRGKAEVTPRGITIKSKELGDKKYWHPDSRVLNDLSLRKMKVFYVRNTLDLTLLHLLDENGSYLETLPLDESVEFFNTEQTEAAHAKKQRQINRLASHMQRTHKVDSDEALERASHNAMEMQRVVQIMPKENAVEQEPLPSRLASQIQEAEQNGRNQTYRDLPAAAVKEPHRGSDVPVQTSRQTTVTELLLAGSNDEDFDF